MSDKINIRKIAELAHCSPSTVSRVLAKKTTDIKISAATRARIDLVCRELDYQPNIHAARLFGNRAQCIGFLPSREFFILDDNLARSMNTVFFELNRYGYRCLPLINDNHFIAEKDYLKLFKRREVDALIVWGALGNPAWLAEMEAEGLPFMLLTNPLGHFPAISCDNYAGTAGLVRHCRTHGAQRFVYLNIPIGGCCEQRYAGFREALGNCHAEVINVGMTIEDGAAAVKQVMSLRPDAVICGNDRLAFGLERALLQAGVRIPEDIMLVGGDNIEMSKYAPVPLSTFDQMAESCAEACVAALVNLLEHDQPLASKVIAPQLIMRQSTP